MPKTHPITPQGLEKIKKEVDTLEQKRSTIIKEIEVARGFGDLSENAEYHSAKERLGQIQKRIRHLKEAIMGAQVIDISKLSGPKIMFGATVALCCPHKKTSEKYQIVGDTESDIKNNKISIFSALARGLIGKNEGETVTISTPGGENTYTIQSVQYIDIGKTDIG